MQLTFDKVGNRILENCMEICQLWHESSPNGLRSTKQSVLRTLRIIPANLRKTARKVVPLPLHGSGVKNQLGEGRTRI